MSQLTVFNPDGSVVDVFFIPDDLALELTDILKKIKLESLA